MKNLVNLQLALLVLITANGIAQKQPKNTKATAIITYNNETTVYKDENGKTLAVKQVMEYVHTGDYKMEKAVDKDKKPYMLVKKIPGYNRRPVAEAVVVKP